MKAAFSDVNLMCARVVTHFHIVVSHFSTKTRLLLLVMRCLYFSSSCLVVENKNIYTRFAAAINPDTDSERSQQNGKHDEGKSVESNYRILQSTPDAERDGCIQRFVARFVMKASLMHPPLRRKFCIHS